MDAKWYPDYDQIFLNQLRYGPLLDRYETLCIIKYSELDESFKAEFEENLASIVGLTKCFVNGMTTDGFEAAMSMKECLDKFSQTIPQDNISIKENLETLKCSLEKAEEFMRKKNYKSLLNFKTNGKVDSNDIVPIQQFSIDLNKPKDVDLPKPIKYSEFICQKENIQQPLNKSRSSERSLKEQSQTFQKKSSRKQKGR